MRTFSLAGAAALALLAAPVALSAQAAQQTADQANAQAQPAPQNTQVVPAPAPGQPATVVTNNPGNLTAPPQQAFNKTYPPCSRTLHDNCQNPGEGGAAGRSRALGHWPGEAASERTDRGG